jgi:uncharacterized protein (DUF302 family)
MADGLITLESNFGPQETSNRLVAEVAVQGMTIFARVDHAAGAAEVGMTLGPTELLIFGNAKAGTPLMQEQQSTGIDLPLKALVYQDTSGKTWLAYNDPAWLARRHDLPTAAAVSIKSMTSVLAAISARATRKE